jgi:Gas vesicle protein
VTYPSPWTTSQPTASNLADVLERVLDKGLVIAGDIKVCLLDIELLTIKLRLLVASVDKAREMGIDWWEYDPSLSSRHRPPPVAEGDQVTVQVSAPERVNEVKP